MMHFHVYFAHVNYCIYTDTKKVMGCKKLYGKLLLWGYAKRKLSAQLSNNSLPIIRLLFVFCLKLLLQMYLVAVQQQIRITLNDLYDQLNSDRGRRWFCPGRPLSVHLLGHCIYFVLFLEKQNKTTNVIIISKQTNWSLQ